MQDSHVALGKKIKELRLKAALTEVDMCRALQRSVTTYREFESGNAVPSVITLQRLADVFNVNLDELIAYTPEIDCVSIKWGFLNDLSRNDQELIRRIGRRIGSK